MENLKREEMTALSCQGDIKVLSTLVRNMIPGEFREKYNQVVNPIIRDCEANFEVKLEITNKTIKVEIPTGLVTGIAKERFRQENKRRKKIVRDLPRNVR